MTHERQGDAGNWEHPNHHPRVNYHLKEEYRCQTDQEEGPGTVWSHLRPIEQTQEQSKVQQKNEQRSDKSLFFGEGGENGIRMGYGDESQPALRAVT